MARPIKDTPILLGEDASRFVQRMEQVKLVSKKERERAKDAYETIRSISNFPL